MVTPGGSGHNQDRDRCQDRRQENSSGAHEVPDGEENSKRKKDGTEQDMEEAMKRFQRLEPPPPRNRPADAEVPTAGSAREQGGI